VHADPVAAAQTVIKSLFWITGYHGYEKFLETWGSAIQARRHPQA
jgi:hypothetical protein